MWHSTEKNLVKTFNVKCDDPQEKGMFQDVDVKIQVHSSHIQIHPEDLLYKMKELFEIRKSLHENLNIEFIFSK